MPSTRTVVRIVVTVALTVVALYLVWLLRRPIGWIVLAAFVAVCASGPISKLERRMPRGAAIALVYLAIVLTPLAIGAILVPPVVRQAAVLVNDLPGYVRDLNQTVQDNKQLRELDDNYDLIGRLQSFAGDLVRSAGQAAVTIADIGVGLLNSLFALFTILVLSVFLVSRGRRWALALVRMRPPEQAARLQRAFEHIAVAIGAYVGGALLQALVAGVAAFTVLSILGIPSPLALALVVAILDVIPLLGATIGAVVVGVVTLFHDFPTDTIVWVAFAIAYQQFENYVVQPRIQSRAVDLDPFVIVVAALFGGTLLGIIGALLAIPAAAAIQIAVREYLDYRRAVGSLRA